MEDNSDKGILQLSEKTKDYINYLNDWNIETIGGGTNLERIRAGTYVIYDYNVCKVLEIYYTRPGKHGGTKGILKIIDLHTHKIIDVYLSKVETKEIIKFTPKRKKFKVIAIKEDKIVCKEKYEHNIDYYEQKDEKDILFSDPYFHDNIKTAANDNKIVILDIITIPIKTDKIIYQDIIESITIL